MAMKGAVMSDKLYPVPVEWAETAKIDAAAYQEMYRRSIDDPAANCLDRHLAERGDSIAILWEPDDPDSEERRISYAELHRDVCRFANVLKAQGVGRGDRVTIYLPMVPEAAVAMLACARIGAIHSVVYAGLGHAALRDRIIDAGAKVVITGDVGFRRGKAVPLKSIADEAVADLDFVEKIVVYSRRQPKMTFVSRREIDFEDLMNFPDKCDAENSRSSGSTPSVPAYASNRSALMRDTVPSRRISR
jgi:acetyl-CoA synthetase